MAKSAPNSEFQRLGLPLGILLAAIGVSIGLVATTKSVLDAARQQLQRQQSVLHAERQRVNKADDEKKAIQRYRDAYVRLQRQGFIGEEQRINWIDALRNANFALKLFGIDYSIGAQIPYAEPVSLPAAVQLRESPMRLGLKLLHEEDLLRVFDYLAAQHVGVFHPRSCSLTRIEAAAKPSITANLEATCEIAWITVQPPQQRSAGSASR